MEIIRTVEWMKQVARDAQAKERLVGLVPTMGALHAGHQSLVRAARKECSPVVVSIFVNPMQFGPTEDFKKYPRSMEQDAAALESLSVDYLFAPSAADMYPDGFRTAVTVEGLGDRLEGRSRPSHFRGVATVVLKLFEIIQPRFAYFGRKDAQQVRIIQQMAGDLNLDTQVIACPIVREPDGLAMSSRNAYLFGDDRRDATVLFRSLNAMKKEIEAGELDAARLIATIRGVFDAEPGAALDYAEIVDANSLEPVIRLRKSCLALVAAFIGKTRLIDNALIEESAGSFSVTL
ncbi:MAG: pantoate--beta-alanine ligase [Candidatus Acidiferrales bacterium]|jgi:pantoate--beta-alanine ligase